MFSDKLEFLNERVSECTEGARSLETLRVNLFISAEIHLSIDISPESVILLTEALGTPLEALKSELRGGDVSLFIFLNYQTFIRGVDFFKDFCYTNIDIVVKHRFGRIGCWDFTSMSTLDLCLNGRARVLGNAGFGIPLLPDLCHFNFFKRNSGLKGILPVYILFIYTRSSYLSIDFFQRIEYTIIRISLTEPAAF